MNVLAIYAVNDHINQLMADAQQARVARETSGRPSLVRRMAGAVRSAFTRPATPQATGSAA